MGLGRIGNERELGVLLSQIAFVARMLAAVVVINEGTEAGNGHERREPDHGQQESERSSAQPAAHTLSKDRRPRFLARAVPPAALIELREDRTPFLALRLFPLVEVFQMLRFGLYIPC